MKKIDDARIRSAAIAESLRQRTDQRLRDRIAQLPAPNFQIDDLMISPLAWDHVQSSHISPHFVFAHPSILHDCPETSLYYRGMSLLPQKRVGNIVSDVSRWESGEWKKRPSTEKCLDVARLYNMTVSSIIEGSTNWTLENGYRNVIATMAIGLDGTARNLVGQAAEALIRSRIVQWLRQKSLLDNDPDDQDLFYLPNDTIMRFGSDPDIQFERDQLTVTTVEIKGGKDPAGALERLGAVQKSFDATPAGCVNILVAGVITREMRNRLTDLGVVKVFLLDDLAQDGQRWEEFTTEVFHHAARAI